MQKKPIPTIGEKYHFFDDGKITISRHNIATVTDIITPEQAKDVIIKKIEWDGAEEYIDEVTLYDIWISEIDKHRQHEHFKIINAPSTETGKPWLYDEETDYFIKCFIPEYDTNDIWFVRTVNGGWFSMDTVTTWMSGELDVTGDSYEKMKKFYKEEYGEECD